MNQTRLSLLVLPLTLWGCSAPEPAAARAPDPRVEADLQRYREPFGHEQTVIADRLDIEMSANFFSELAQPSVDRSYHQASHERYADHDTYRWVNQGGGAEVPLKLAIGRQRYIVLQEARLKVLTKPGAVAMRATASGRVAIVDGGQSRSVDEFRIEDGSVRTR